MKTLTRVEVSLNMLSELLYGELTPAQAIELETIFQELYEVNFKKAVILRAFNVCEKEMLGILRLI